MNCLTETSRNAGVAVRRLLELKVWTMVGLIQAARLIDGLGFSLTVIVMNQSLTLRQLLLVSKKVT